MLTALRAGRPSSTSRICSATSIATFSWASSVDAPRWGVSTRPRSTRPQGGVFRQGLTGVNIQARTGDHTVVDGFSDRRLIHHAAAITAAATWVPERIINPSYSPMIPISSSSERPVR